LKVEVEMRFDGRGITQLQCPWQLEEEVTMTGGRELSAEGGMRLEVWNRGG
jgi:hypothetical protein